MMYDLPTATQMMNPHSLSLKVRLGKHESFSYYVCPNKNFIMFGKLIYYIN